MLSPGTTLYDELHSGEYTLPDERELLMELR
jgi:hypothetical protein